MKFSDLNFEQHFIEMGATQAKHTFPNGYGVSVIACVGLMFYTALEAP